MNIVCGMIAEEEEDNSYLVDFQQKYIDKALRHHEADDVITNTENTIEDDWYDYIYVCIIMQNFNGNIL